GQILASLHLIMVALTALSLKKPWAATVTGFLKGLLEAFLFSYHGVPVIAMSGIQGSVIDSLLYVFGYNSRTRLMFGCGLAALSNVLFIQFFLRLPFPSSVYTLMYISSFISGMTMGAYLTQKLNQMIEKRV
ncbi:MAG: ECF transporter S component, partial [Candidatus Bathyarchaeia archaeon]